MRKGHARLLAGALALGAGLSGAAAAQATGFDDTFGVNGTAFTPLSPVSDRYYNATRAPGGGTYNVGYTTVAGSDRAFVLTRVDAAGELVPSFGNGGVAVVNVVTGPFEAPPAGNAPNGGAEIARGVVVQPDGKIVVSGQAETPPGIGKPDSRDIDIYVARFNSDGTRDDSFGTDGVKRIDLSNGVGAGNTVNGDQTYGLSLRPQRQAPACRLARPRQRHAGQDRPRDRGRAAARQRRPRPGLRHGRRVGRDQPDSRRQREPAPRRAPG